MARYHGVVRVLAALANSAMVLFIYAVHLSGFEWDSLGGATQSRRLADYLWVWELEPAFEHLRVLSFSDAMLQHLNIYMLVGTPVGIVFFVLEHNRVRWLQTLVKECTHSNEQATRGVLWLEAYLWTLSAGLVSVLLLPCFHIELPVAHYLCAASAFGFCFASVCIYLLMPIDFSTLSVQAESADDQEGDFAVWALWVQNLVWPVLKVVLGLHIAAVVAGLVKVHFLDDSRAALLFGIFETSVIVGYQFFLAVFAVDDAMVGRFLAQKEKDNKAVTKHNTIRTRDILMACQ